MSDMYAEETLDDAATRIETQAEKLVDQMVLLAEEARKARLAARRRAAQTPVDIDADVVRPVPLEGLSEAHAVLDYKSEVLLAIRWLQGHGNDAPLGEVRAHYGDRIGLDVFDALVLLEGR